MPSVLCEEDKRPFVCTNEELLRSTYIPVEPDEYDEAIYETGVNSGINFDSFNEIEVKVSGLNVPEKIEHFETCNTILDVLMENIKKCKFKEPTPIQKYTIPIILSGKDLMASAQTGSGKTVRNRILYKENFFFYSLFYYNKKLYL